ncbi:tRNA pseudouridine(38-40) synthase TruA [Achromobacter sp. F4_2707]|uniref:tRNA pseudouridine(38-40) synthase TruA n=1 Tax=Achromobacter sp. F4_2707 TaxID=3114286 RepID=UPI0039C717AC
MARIALGLAYDGAPWQGWQTQPGGRTVQDRLEAALASFLAQPVSTICAGRTDTGVHALEQVVHLDAPVERRMESWVRGVNASLPPSIRVQWACPVGDDFHARFSAHARSYVYLLRAHRVASPILHGKTGWIHRPLNLEHMRQAAAYLLGEHDFSAFRSSECQAASPVRLLERLDITQHGEFFVFSFRANAFLHHMVRNLMGALVEVGKGKYEPSWMAELLAQRDRRKGPATFSAAGLYLARAHYPESYGLPSLSESEALLSHLGIQL